MTRTRVRTHQMEQGMFNLKTNRKKKKSHAGHAGHIQCSHEVLESEVNDQLLKVQCVKCWRKSDI